jgi:hypothetical protein
VKESVEQWRPLRPGRAGITDRWLPDVTGRERRAQITTPDFMGRFWCT